MLNKIKKLSNNTLLSKSIIYRELKDIFMPEDTDEEILNIIYICFSVYLKKDYATLIGIAQCARKYINELRAENKGIHVFDYETLYKIYHFDGDWY